jgi:DNA recombination protein RmuC
MWESAAVACFVAALFFAWRAFSLQLELTGVKVRLEEEQKQAQEKLQIIRQAQESMKDSFKALASDTLRSQQSVFLDVAKTTFEKYSADMQQKQQSITEVVKPLRESLEKVDTKIQELEKTRVSAYASVTETLRTLNLSQNELHLETSKLSRSLRASNVRGQWGEMQLRRVVELAGMVEYCDLSSNSRMIACS